MINGSGGIARGFGSGAVLAAVVILSAGSLSRLAGQSVSQEFPTPVTTSEITGVIKPRDLGDPRLTSHFYLVETDVGDLFVNVLTRNFTGDIDLFTQNGLQPFGKIVVYADLAENETGRVIYLRKPEKLLLRIQGRTPGDEPATYRIKFAGSFIASSAAENLPPELPELSAIANEGNVRVNAVGTIVAAPTRRVPEKIAKAERPPVGDKISAAEKQGEEIVAEKPVETRDGESAKKVEVVITDGKSEPTKLIPPREGTRVAEARKMPVKTRIEKAPPTDVSENSKRAERATEERAQKPPKQRPAAKIDPLASIRLVVSFKDGRTIERPMSEVLRFNVDKGQLTIISKDGGIGRYSLLDVARITIE